MQVSDQQLGDFLFDAGLLSRGELGRAQEVARERDETLAGALVHAGILQDDDVRRALAHVLGVPFVQLHKGAVDTEVLVLLPEPFSRTHNVVAFAGNGREVEIALLDLADLDAANMLLPQGTKALPRLTSRESIKHALIQYQKHLKDTFGTRLSQEVAQLQASHARGDASGHDATVRAADALVQHALYTRATDMHLEPHANGLRVRYRLGRDLFDAMTLPTIVAVPIMSRLKLLAQLPLTSDVPGVGRFKIAPQGDEQVSVVVSSTPRMYADMPSETLVVSFAHEHETKQGLSLRSLGFSQAHIQHIRRMLAQPSGIIFVCGGGGTGKTTLMYTLLDELAHPTRRSASVEARVSYTLPSVSQMEINEQVGLTAASCVRAQLRQDVDVLMIDCPLDEETALLAAQAANRGALVLVSVEAASVAEGISALRAFDLPPAMLASTYVGSIATLLVPKLCQYSRTQHKLSRAEQTTLENTIDIRQVLDELREERVLEAHTAWKDLVLYSSLPCTKCDGGYAGTIGLHEVAPATRMLEDLIRAGAERQALQAQIRQDGNATFVEDALAKTIQSLLSIEELLQVAGQ